MNRIVYSLKLALFLVCGLFLATTCESGEKNAESVFTTELASARSGGGPPGATSDPAAGDLQGPGVPVKDMVTMVDLGAKSCVPCKMMAPILVEMEAEYRGRAAVVFIDVWERPDQTPRFGIRAIPTQIFYDKSGKEVMRHEGFMGKEDIRKVLDKLLAS